MYLTPGDGRVDGATQGDQPQIYTEEGKMGVSQCTSHSELQESRDCATHAHSTPSPGACCRVNMQKPSVSPSRATGEL